MNTTELQFWRKNEVWAQNKNKNTTVTFTKEVPSTFRKGRGKACQQFAVLWVFPLYFSTTKVKVKHFLKLQLPIYRWSCRDLGLLSCYSGITVSMSDQGSSLSVPKVQVDSLGQCLDLTPKFSRDIHNSSVIAFLGMSQHRQNNRCHI